MDDESDIESEAGLLKKIVGWLLQPKATIFLIAATIVASIYGFSLTEGAFSTLMLSPSGLLSGNYLSLISSIFIHANLRHLLGNMFFLFVMGRVVESRFGGLKMIALYTVSGIFAGLLHIALQMLVFGTNVLLLGASGAISGLIAAALLYKPFQLTFLFGIPLPILVVGWAGILKDLIGATAELLGINISDIAFFAHLGGYIGMVLGLFLLADDKRPLFKGLLINLVFAGVLVFTGIWRVLV